MSEDMSPYCSVHDELLIMKLCMLVDQYHNANNVTHFGGDPVTQFNFKNVKNCHFVFQNMRRAGYHEKMIGRFWW